MTHMAHRIVLSVGVAAVVAFLATVALAEEEKEIPWDHAFNGHEMWTNSIEEGLKTSTELSRHLLIDLYSRG